MDQNVKSSSMDAAVAPGSGVDLRLEEREVETLHVALAAGIAQGLEIAPVGPVILVRQLLGEVLPAAPAASGRQCHFQTNALPRRGTAKSFSPLFPRCPLNKSRDACTRRSAELFSRRCKSHVQHQFLHGFSPLSRRNSRPRMHLRAPLSPFRFTVTRVRSSGENRFGSFACWKRYSPLCDVRYTGPACSTREIFKTESFGNFNFSRPFSNI